MANQAYPFPALVLLLRCPSSPAPPPSHPLNQPWNSIEPFTLTEPFRPVWANGHWARVAGKRAFLDCITINEARRMGDWLTGVTSWGVRRKLADSWAAHGDDVLAEARSREHLDPVARQLISKRGSPPYAREHLGEYEPLGAEALEADLAGEAGTITVEFSFPRGKAQLELVLTTLPLLEKNGMASSTNSLAVLTAIPRSNLSLFRRGATSSPEARSETPSAVGSPLLRSPHNHHTRKVDKLFNGQPVVHNWVSGNPIYIMNNGTIFPQSPPTDTMHPSGLPLDVRTLLWSTDWSRTPVGPMNQWPSTLRQIRECVPRCC